MTLIVPPIKCQGIKTKLVPLIKQNIIPPIVGTWIEPFCGSCVVALNVQPKRALLADTNTHIINLYRCIQDGTITSGTVKRFLEQEAQKLSGGGEKYYYAVRERFNESGDALDFLFLNRSCFNGVMRFNRHGKFNVPFGHKPERFRQAYITKIVNQVKAFGEVLQGKQWQFEVLGFRDTLARAKTGDFLYCDPPYAGRHVDYFNSWSDTDESDLITLLKNSPSRFLLSTWHSNKYRRNPAIDEHWQDSSFSIRTAEHFYHVGPTEDLRNSMTEALIGNYALPQITEIPVQLAQQTTMF